MPLKQIFNELMLNFHGNFKDIIGQDDIRQGDLKA